MKIDRKLSYWTEAGLLSAAQAEAISAYEKNRHQGRFGKSLASLALFAILTGVLSVIAANWAVIPGSLKIAAHFGLNIGAAFAVWHFHARGRIMQEEGAVFVLFGLTLTLIALIGQVFQLNGSVAGALALWMLIATPFVWVFGRLKLVALSWGVALMVTIFMVLTEWLDHDPDSFLYVWVVCAVTIFLPLLFIALGGSAFLWREKPAFARLLSELGFLLATLWATGASFAWYADRARAWEDLILSETTMGFTASYLLLAAIPVAAVAALWCLFRRHGGWRYDGAGRESFIHLAVSVVFMALPLLVVSDGMDIVGMISFVAYWGFIGWHAHRSGHRSLVSLAVMLLALRIFAIYVEAFGGLLSTGFGLISGGVVLLLLLAIAQKMNRRLTRGGAAS